jgi:hypothetical protein
MTRNDPISAAEKMWRVGLSAIPFKVTSDGKVIGPKGWSKYCDNPPSTQVQLEYTKLLGDDFNSLQIACGRVFDGKRLICIDVDDDRLVPLVEVILGKTVCGRFGSKGIGVFAWADARDDFFKTKKQIKLSDGGLGIELLTRSFGTFIPPSVHRKTGQPYKWVGSELSESLDALPFIERDDWNLVKAAVEADQTLELLDGESTHEPMVELSKQLVRHSDDDGRLVATIQSLFPVGYDGDNNSDSEIGRAITWAREKGFDQDVMDYPEETLKKLNQFSEKFCVVGVGGKVLVLEKGYNIELQRDVYVFWRSADLKDYYLDEPVLVPGKQGIPVPIGIGKVWFTWGQRPKAKSVNLLPDHPPGLINVGGQAVYNVWAGFGVTPEPGDWSTLEFHLKQVVCCGNEEHYNYLKGWLATCVQRPHLQGEVAVVMRGGRGTGKGTVGRMLAGIFGQHYFHTASQNQVAGRFNAHLRDTVVLFADEAFFAGDKRHEGVLKALITEDYLAIEEKFVNVVQTRNRIHLVMATNEEWAVPSGVDERRFFVIQVSDIHKQDESYFRAVNNAIRGAELAALLHDLLEFDLSDFRLRKVPQTEALEDQKRLSLDSIADWLLVLLEEGQFQDQPGWPEAVATQDLHADYVTYTRSKSGRPVQDSMFSKRVQKIVGATTVRRRTGIPATSRSRSLEFPSLAECRKRFDNYTGFETDWPEEEPAEETEKLPTF